MSTLKKAALLLLTLRKDKYVWFSKRQAEDKLDRRREGRHVCKAAAGLSRSKRSLLLQFTCEVRSPLKPGNLRGSQERPSPAEFRKRLRLLLTRRSLI